MTFILILIGVILLGIIIFQLGGKELDKRLQARGGLRSMFSHLVDVLLNMPNANLVEQRPAYIKIEGLYPTSDIPIKYQWIIRVY